MKSSLRIAGNNEYRERVGLSWGKVNLHIEIRGGVALSDGEVA